MPLIFYFYFIDVLAFCNTCIVQFAIYTNRIKTKNDNINTVIVCSVYSYTHIYIICINKKKRIESIFIFKNDFAFTVNLRIIIIVLLDSSYRTILLFSYLMYLYLFTLITKVRIYMWPQIFYHCIFLDFR